MLTLIKKAPLFFFLNHEIVRVRLPGMFLWRVCSRGRQKGHARLCGKYLPPKSSVLNVGDAFKGIMIWLHCNGAPHKVHVKFGFQGGDTGTEEILEEWSW